MSSQQQGGPSSATGPGPPAPGPRRGGAFRPHMQPIHRPPYGHHHPQNRHQRPPAASSASSAHTHAAFRPIHQHQRGRGRGGGHHLHGQHALPALSPRKKLSNVVENEETIKNDYALWYALTGEWSGNWVRKTGASGEEEESAEYPKLKLLLDLKQRQLSSLSHPPFHLSLPSSSIVQPPPSATVSPPLPPVPQNQLHPSYLPYPNPINLSHPHPMPFNPTIYNPSPQPLPYHITHPQPIVAPTPTNPLLTLPTFTTILITPPPDLTWQEIHALPIRQLSADPSFVFLWVGEASGLGLEKGREALLKWGFRRCEEVLWVKTNVKRKKEEGREDGRPAVLQDGKKPRNLLVNQKEHCLMGIRGTVRRKTDGWFVHCNVDTDVIVYTPPEDDPNPPPYPPKLLEVIENFCLGTKRLHLFAPKSRARRGWVTVGDVDLPAREEETQAEHREERILEPGKVEEEEKEEEEVLKDEVAADGEEGKEAVAKIVSEDDEQQQDPKEQALDWDSQLYAELVRPNEMGRYVLPEVAEIENLRPKSPVRGDRGGRSDPPTPAPNNPLGGDTGTLSGRQTPSGYFGPPAGGGRPGSRGMSNGSGVSSPAPRQASGGNPQMMSGGGTGGGGFGMGGGGGIMGMGSGGIGMAMHQQGPNQPHHPQPSGPFSPHALSNPMMNLSVASGSNGLNANAQGFTYTGSQPPSSSSQSAYGNGANGNGMLAPDMGMNMNNPMFMAAAMGAMQMQQMQMQMQAQQQFMMQQNGYAMGGQGQGQGQGQGVGMGMGMGMGMGGGGGFGQQYGQQQQYGQHQYGQQQQQYGQQGFGNDVWDDEYDGQGGAGDVGSQPALYGGQWRHGQM